MTAQKQTVQTYMEGFNEADHEKILDCLTDDIAWDIPGHTYLTGKEAFDKEIENPAFEGKPVINLTRMVQEGNLVIAEGSVKSSFKGGALLDAVFCDVFEFDADKIKKITSYLMQKNQNNIISP
jgi:ketosteroid isomerase-like protein